MYCIIYTKDWNSKCSPFFLQLPFPQWIQNENQLNLPLNGDIFTHTAGFWSSGLLTCCSASSIRKEYSMVETNEASSPVTIGSFSAPSKWRSKTLAFLASTGCAGKKRCQSCFLSIFLERSLNCDKRVLASSRWQIGCCWQVKNSSRSSSTEQSISGPFITNVESISALVVRFQVKFRI